MIDFNYCDLKKVLKFILLHAMAKKSWGNLMKMGCQLRICNSIQLTTSFLTAGLASIVPVSFKYSSNTSRYCFALSNPSHLCSRLSLLHHSISFVSFIFGISSTRGKFIARFSGRTYFCQLGAVSVRSSKRGGFGGLQRPTIENCLAISSSYGVLQQARL